jgi:hypothetical protein
LIELSEGLGHSFLGLADPLLELARALPRLLDPALEGALGIGFRELAEASAKPRP